MTGKLAFAILLTILAAAPAFAQYERGELRLKIFDPKGGSVPALVDLASEANHVRRSFQTGQDGRYVARELPFGVYHLQVSHSGFVPSEQLITIRSEVPLSISVTLGLAPVQTEIDVTDAATLVDPGRAGTIYSAGAQAIHEELPAQMGRGLSDLVVAEPGWLYEANGVLHPRVRPSYALDASAGLNLYSKESKTVSLEIEGSNLTQHLNVINFVSLFSGTAIGVPRSFGAKLEVGY
ncbi:MAG: carboxypeptidase-like regulatory domain-containing protein [Terriglobia bacterium]